MSKKVLVKVNIFENFINLFKFELWSFLINTTPLERTFKPNTLKGIIKKNYKIESSPKHCLNLKIFNNLAIVW